MSLCLSERSDLSVGFTESTEEVSFIFLHLDSAGNSLRKRLEPRYDWFLEQGRTAIVMTMAAHGIQSPFLAAVHLGVCRELTAVIGSEDDAFAVLIQAALQIRSGCSGTEALQ